MANQKKKRKYSPRSEVVNRTNYQLEKNDAVIQVRIPRKYVAMIAMAFHQANNPARTLAELGRRAMKEFANVLAANGIVPRIEDSAEATRALQRAGLGNLNAGGRNVVSYYENLRVEHALEEGYDPYEPTRVKVMRRDSRSGPSDEQQIRFVMDQAQCSREEAIKKLEDARETREVEPKDDPWTDKDEQAAIDKSKQRDQKEKEALAQGPDSSTMINEEE